VSGGQLVEGTVSDPAGVPGAGIDRVEAYLEPDRDEGGKELVPVPNRMKRNIDGDLVAYAFVLDAPRGQHTVYVHAHSATSGRETVVAVPVKIS
jgi:hypothetical protein